MIICLCHRVSDRDIAREAAAGCASFESLQERTCVATACGLCKDDAVQAFDSQCGLRGCNSCPAPAATSAAQAG